MGTFSNANTRWALLFVLAGVLIRLINIDLPILEGANSRQIQTALITRNLLVNGFDFLHPQINSLPEPRYYILEPPLYNTLVAFLYLPFGVHEYLGRLVSILSFAGTCYFIYRIASVHINASAARAAVLAFSLFPLSIIFTRAFQPDPLALFLSVGFIYFTVGWIDGNSRNPGWAIFFGALAFFTKPPYMFILLPLTLYGLAQKGKRFLTRWEVYLALVFLVIPPVLWSNHAKNVAALYPYLDYQGNFALSNWFDVSTFFHYSFYKTVFEWLSGMILTPIGFTLLLMGLFVKGKPSGDRLLGFWLLGVVIYDLMFHKHIHTHEYYHLPLLPVAALLIGKAWWFFFEQEGSPGKTLGNRPAFRIVWGLVLVGMVYGYSNSGFKLPASVKDFQVEQASLNQNTKDEDLIIVTESRYLYYGNNIGWRLPYNIEKYSKELDYWLPEGYGSSVHVSLIEAWRKQGAAYFFETDPDAFFRHRELADYMMDNYPVVDRKEGTYILFNLKEKIPSRIQQSNTPPPSAEKL